MDKAIKTIVAAYIIMHPILLLSALFGVQPGVIVFLWVCVTFTAPPIAFTLMVLDA